MTDEEAIRFYEELETWFGDKLVNFENHPIQFANQIKLYRYYKERNASAQSQSIE
jgi:hypothetical protein